ncbi:hypothetical protein PHYPO_G00168740 [Pangasianodon hypophthalmus]|uniref:THAP-type domain-containing protein n=1 Tax=Pangasianodon hypophthalmus TaxID=310915 RepID=A0A5N5JGA6_PANHP|nr:hypothetical protein PHYPO_G00168740 [Pangasianodon hypophthalmus]
MGHTCVVSGCRSRSGDKVKRKFFSIPAVRLTEGARTEELSRWRRALWIERISRKDFKPTKYSKVCSDHFVTGDKAELYDFTHLDWAPSVKMTTESNESCVKQSEENLKGHQRLDVKSMEIESSAQTCDQTVSLQRLTQSDSKDASVSRVARVLREAEKPEPQMLSTGDVKRRTASSGIQCPYCRYRCGAKFSFQIHVGSQHPLQCEDVCVGRLGKVVFYQRTAKLFHCHICFFTSKDYAVLFEHLLARHCFTVRKAVQTDEDDEVTDEGDTEVRHREGHEQDRSPNPEIKPDNDDATEQRKQETSNEDALKKRKRSSVSSGEDDEHEDVNVSDSMQAANEEQAAAVERYSENSSAPYYDCKFCKRRCKSKISLLRHVSRNHDVPKPHVCKECSETFMLQSLLTRHINLLHRQELYQCPYCLFESSLQGLHQHLSHCRAVESNQDKADVGTEEKE